MPQIKEQSQTETPKNETGKPQLSEAPSHEMELMQEGMKDSIQKDEKPLDDSDISKEDLGKLSSEDRIRYKQGILKKDDVVKKIKGEQPENDSSKKDDKNQEPSKEPEKKGDVESKESKPTQKSKTGKVRVRGKDGNIIEVEEAEILVKTHEGEEKFIPSNTFANDFSFRNKNTQEAQRLAEEKRKLEQEREDFDRQKKTYTYDSVLFGEGEASTQESDKGKSDPKAPKRPTIAIYQDEGEDEYNRQMEAWEAYQRKKTIEEYESIQTSKKEEYDQRMESYKREFEEISKRDRTGFHPLLVKPLEEMVSAGELEKYKESPRAYYGLYLEALQGNIEVPKGWPDSYRDQYGLNGDNPEKNPKQESEKETKKGEEKDMTPPKDESTPPITPMTPQGSGETMQAAELISKDIDFYTEELRSGDIVRQSEACKWFRNNNVRAPKPRKL